MDTVAVDTVVVAAQPAAKKAATTKKAEPKANDKSVNVTKKDNSTVSGKPSAADAAKTGDLKKGEGQSVTATQKANTPSGKPNAADAFKKNKQN